MKQILIYRDFGGSINFTNRLFEWAKEYLPNFEIKFTDAEQIITGDVLSKDKVKAIFIPGGASRGYREKLEGIGNQKIKEFIKNGGAYYGFCAGGYLPAAKTVFTGEDYSIERNNEELKFFNGIAKGSIPELTNNIYYNENVSSANTVTIEYDGKKKAEIYYHGGGRFVSNSNKTDSHEILAVYKKLKEGENAAVVKCDFGKGFAILTGIHPEINANTFKDMNVTNTKNKNHIAKIQSSLDKNESQNKDFNQYLLRNLLKER